MINYGGEVCFNNNESPHNALLIVKAMIGQCGAAADRKGSARKQGGKIAGQRESRRKGGY